jgi:hypothetical protein
VENLFEFDGGESTLADLDQGSDQISDHPVKKTVPLEGQFQNTALFFDDSNGANGPHGRLALVPRVGGKGREVVFPGQNLSGFAQRGEIKGAWDVPSASDFERVKRIGISDSVNIGFSFGREAGVKSRFLTSNGEDSNPCREMKVEGFRESGGWMKRGDFAGGDLAEGMNAPISSAGSCHGHRPVENFLQGFLEGELDGGIRILALPAEEVFSAVGEKETVRNRLHGRVSGFRLGARDRRSSR